MRERGERESEREREGERVGKTAPFFINFKHLHSFKVNGYTFMCFLHFYKGRKLFDFLFTSAPGKKGLQG